jgi:anhydro-N-acetylmuramic acid kinase
MPDTNLYIGLMSGTSADGIDVALVDFNNNAIKLLAHSERPIEPEIKDKILQLCQPGDNEIERMGALDRQLGGQFAIACMQLLLRTKLPATAITAIGSHGQTIRHRPTLPPGNAFTLQIGDANTIAERTGITTVSDFRRRDIAAGGQGAPLAPAFHKAAFHSSKTSRAVVNIGGMANISYLPSRGEVIGFDTGPGNVLLDTWIFHKQSKAYDRDGAWAASGKCIPSLLQQLLQHPYFHLSPPKSTGREAFNLTWLLEQLRHYAEYEKDKDIQATLLELTAVTISQDILALSQEEILEVYICGGGAYNGQLMHRLAQLLAEHSVASTEKLGIAPEWVEAVAFAWLAKQTMERQSGNLPAVTGAQRSVPLGGIYWGF